MADEPTTEPEPTTNPAEVVDESGQADQPAAPGDEAEESAPDSDALDKVRREAKNLRDRLHAAEARADGLARRLHTELTRASGKLADPSDLEFSPDSIDSPEALAAAIDSLLEAKPHLRSRIPAPANVGQGAKDQGQPVGLLTHLKSLV